MTTVAIVFVSPVSMVTHIAVELSQMIIYMRVERHFFRPLGQFFIRSMTTQTLGPADSCSRSHLRCPMAVLAVNPVSMCLSEQNRPTAKSICEVNTLSRSSDNSSPNIFASILLFLIIFTHLFLGLEIRAERQLLNAGRHFLLFLSRVRDRPGAETEENDPYES